MTSAFGPPPLRIETHDFEDPQFRFRLTIGKPVGPLAARVDHFWEVAGETGYVQERIVPTAHVDLLVNLGPPQRLVDRDDPTQVTVFGEAWISGMQSRCLVVDTSGRCHLLGVRLRPVAASEVLGIPLDELNERVVDLAQVLRIDIAELRDRLHAATGPLARFSILIALLAARRACAPAPDPLVDLALHQLEANAGELEIGALATGLRVSHKHLIDRFKRRVGLTPRLYARVVRFRGVVDALKEMTVVDWTTLALRSGYYDQAHFIRDFKQFAGATPTEFLRTRGPDGDSLVGGRDGDEVKSVQSRAARSA